MATIQIFHEEDGRISTVTVNLQTGILSDPSNLGTRDSWLLISTNLRRPDGTGFPIYLARNLSDTAPGFGVATDFTELVEGYIEYFMDQAELGYSSSSSSSSTSESSDSSEGYSQSSTSSEGYSVSSDSTSSSTSEGYSESSSSSEGNSESSSSTDASESSSSS